jgi:hypothetical protein
MSQQLPKYSSPLSLNAITDSAPLYSSFEQFEPGLQLLSNDPSSEDSQQVLRQQQRQQKQQRELYHDTTPQGGTTNSCNPVSDDSGFIDLLYIVDPAGKTAVMNITSPGPVSAPLAPPASAASHPSEQNAPPAQHGDLSQTSSLPPLSAAFNTPSTTTPIIAGSSSVRALLGPELELEEANELDYEAKLMSWWPSSGADELKVERM